MNEQLIPNKYEKQLKTHSESDIYTDKRATCPRLEFLVENKNENIFDGVAKNGSKINEHQKWAFEHKIVN